MKRTFRELRRLETFDERFDYLKLGGSVAHATFGAERYLNQQFYRSREWRQIRRDVIARDMGCDLGIEGHEIFDQPYVHHMNPMIREDLRHGDPSILDPDFLITVSLRTHNAIHYGDRSTLPKRHVDRTPGDTKLW